VGLLHLKFLFGYLLQGTITLRLRNRLRVNSPSANPKLSTTGRSAETLKKAVPSFISSATILPRRFATTPYTFPNTSAGSPLQYILQHKISHKAYWKPEFHMNTWQASILVTNRVSHCDKHLLRMR